MAVSKDQKLVASGELGARPAIHLWDPDTKKNIMVFKGVHV